MMELLIQSQGLIRTLYDEVIPLHSLGKVQLSRASHVESDARGEWTADLGPSSGPVLGPFQTRTAALQAERDWLTAHLLFPERHEHSERKFTDAQIPQLESVPKIPLRETPTVQTSADRAHLPRQSVGSHSQ